MQRDRGPLVGLLIIAALGLAIYGGFAALLAWGQYNLALWFFALMATASLLFYLRATAPDRKPWRWSEAIGILAVGALYLMLHIRPL